MHTIILSDLIAIGLVLIEIVFPVPTTFRLYLTIECQRRPDSRNQGSLLKLWLSSRESGVEESNMGIGVRIHRGASAREELMRRVQFGVNLDAHGQFILSQPRSFPRGPVLFEFLLFSFQVFQLLP